LASTDCGFFGLFARTSICYDSSLTTRQVKAYTPAWTQSTPSLPPACSVSVPYPLCAASAPSYVT
jgi:hypothetical protein